jgi:hypothetical protein
MLLKRLKIIHGKKELKEFLKVCKFMPKSYNSNILYRTLKGAASFWDSASRYQIFILLAAVAMLVMLFVFNVKLDDKAGAMLNIVIFCAVMVGGFLLLRLKGSQMAAFTFASALLLRFCLILLLENSTPFMRDDVRIRNTPWIRHYDSVLFEADEFFYVYQGQRYNDTTIGEFINSPEFTNHAYRAGFLLSKIFRFFGDELIWPRIVGVLLGAFAAAIICLTAEQFFSKESSAIVSLLSALAPQTAFYSVRFLKEIWVIFAASLIIFGFAMIIRNKKPITAILSITAAIVIFMWIRLEYGLMFIAAIPVAICFRHKSNPAGKTAAVLSMILLGIIIFFYQFNKLTDKAEALFDRYTSAEKTNIARLDVMDKIYKSRGPLRLLNIPFALLNLPPKNLHCIYTAENRLYDSFLLASIYQWWIPLPFLIIGTCLIITRRTELLALLLPYTIAIITSALLIGGLQTDILRYRDSLAPIAFIIIGAGIEGFLISPKSWKNRIIVTVYTIFVMLAVYFYIRDF